MKYLLTFFLMCAASFGQNGGLNFGGTLNGINYGTSSEFNLTNDGFTVTSWICLDAVIGAGPAVISKDDQTSQRSYYILTRATQIVTRVQVGAAGLSLVANLTNDLKQVHHHVAFSRNNLTGVHKIYLDGVIRAQSTNATGKPVVTTSPLWVARWGGAITDRFNGSQEDTRIYDRVLTDQEILEITANPWMHSDDAYLVLRTCVETNDTGISPVGEARNLGTGSTGTYFNAMSVSIGKIQTEKPLTMELP